jgi:hypothetical protein
VIFNEIHLLIKNVFIHGIFEFLCFFICTTEMKHYDWEVDVFALFFNFLYSFRLRRGGADKLC